LVDRIGPNDAFAHRLEFVDARPASRCWTSGGTAPANFCRSCFAIRLPTASAQARSMPSFKRGLSFGSTEIIIFPTHLRLVLSKYSHRKSDRLRRRHFAQGSVRGCRGCQANCSRVAAGRRPALAHFRHRSRPARRMHHRSEVDMGRRLASGALDLQPGGNGNCLVAGGVGDGSIGVLTALPLSKRQIGNHRLCRGLASYWRGAALSVS
jgi:hypothetical protein